MLLKPVFGKVIHFLIFLTGVPKSTSFTEHVWIVKIRNEDLGKETNLAGTHRLCLNARAFTLVLFRMPLTEPPEMWEFPIMSIRQCGLFGRRFFLEMGRATPTGPGRLWMKVEKTSIGLHLHWTIIWAMRDSAANHLSSSLRAHCSSISESVSSTQSKVMRLPLCCCEAKCFFLHSPFTG